MKDKQNNEIKVGVAYQYAFAMPGPDVSCVIVKSLNDDGTVEVFDVLFCRHLIVKGEQLLRPLKHGWDAWKEMSDAAVKYGGSLDLSVGCKLTQEDEK
ncbi:hypothetical protein CI612_27285 [Klebsiella quasipneumoniae subsp. similipneumoniae]|uniref:hypothetical protein n=1 Tax=Klebsiella quasipneumoniae TaxID=1463165 RepID=UPI000B95727A|nr:hypothetical protein [Klebsiella quasipneumoniae]OYF73413.1 hypothetical protein CI612_27285 [Klebsiella quasipneumoniae subsp. similipneumoniae]